MTDDKAVQLLETIPNVMSADKTFQLLERFTCHGFYTITGKCQEQSAIFPISVNMAVLRIVIIVRISESCIQCEIESSRQLRFLLKEDCQNKVLKSRLKA